MGREAKYKKKQERGENIKEKITNRQRQRRNPTTKLQTQNRPETNPKRAKKPTKSSQSREKRTKGKGQKENSLGKTHSPLSALVPLGVALQSNYSTTRGHLRSG